MCREDVSHSITYNLGQVWEGKCPRVGICILHTDVTLVDAPNLKKNLTAQQESEKHTLEKLWTSPETFVVWTVPAFFSGEQK